MFIYTLSICTIQGLEAEVKEREVRLREELKMKDAEINRLGQELRKLSASPKREFEAAKV